MATMTLLSWAFDLLLGAGLLWLAWRTLACRELFKAIVLFIAFGLFMSLAWVRLQAPDVALAEAAIGAGLTGALLLAALARLRVAETPVRTKRGGRSKRRQTGMLSWLPFTALTFAAGGLGYALSSLPNHAAGLSGEVMAHLDGSGVSNPVTAVLLNFRGYDTLLEMAVLLLALLAVWSLGVAPLHQGGITSGIVLDILSRLLTPLLILVAAYLLWVGADAPGGAFQAGSVLGAVPVLLFLAGWRLRAGLTALPLRLLLVAGPGCFVTMAAFTLLFSGQLLEYPPEQAGKAILILEATATLSIGATLAALFMGSRPQEEENP